MSSFKFCRLFDGFGATRGPPASGSGGWRMAKQPRRSAEGNLIYVLDPSTAEQLLEEIKEHGIVVLR